MLRIVCIFLLVVPYCMLIKHKIVFREIVIKNMNIIEEFNILFKVTSHFNT